MSKRKRVTHHYAGRFLALDSEKATSYNFYVSEHPVDGEMKILSCLWAPYGNAKQQKEYYWLSVQQDMPLSCIKPQGKARSTLKQAIKSELDLGRKVMPFSCYEHAFEYIVESDEDWAPVCIVERLGDCIDISEIASLKKGFYSSKLGNEVRLLLYSYDKYHWVKKTKTLVVKDEKEYRSLEEALISKMKNGEEVLIHESASDLWNYVREIADGNA